MLWGKSWVNKLLIVAVLPSRSRDYRLDATACVDRAYVHVQLAVVVYLARTIRINRLVACIRPNIDN